MLKCWLLLVHRPHVNEKGLKFNRNNTNCRLIVDVNINEDNPLSHMLMLPAIYN